MGLTFAPTPSVPTADLDRGERRGFVYIGDERPANDTFLDAVLVTSIIGGEIEDADAIELIDDVRGALLDAALAWSDAKLNNLAQMLAYEGSTPARSGDGHLVLTARHFTFAARYVNPLPSILA
jgi:hypothetical protein